MLNKIIFVLLFSFSSAGYAIFESRLPVEDEYDLMRQCVSSSSQQRWQIKICACALRMTIADGIWLAYDAESYRKNKREFVEKFSENVVYFSKDIRKCN